jgi:hypothetical protein
VAAEESTKEIPNAVTLRSIYDTEDNVVDIEVVNAPAYAEFSYDVLFGLAITPWAQMVLELPHGVKYRINEIIKSDFSHGFILLGHRIDNET